MKNFQHVFRQLDQIRVNHYLDIGNFYFTKEKFTVKNQIWENRFLCLKFFPYFGAQIGQQQFFIIWQDGQTPRQLFFTNAGPNGRTGNQSIFGSQIEKKKKNTFYNGPNWPGNLVTFFTQTNFTIQKPNLGKSFFGAKFFS